MEIDIPIKKLKVKDISFAYGSSFLKLHNFFYCHDSMFDVIVKTKYGYMAIDKQDYITYLGNGVWSVTRNEQR